MYVARFHTDQLRLVQVALRCLTHNRVGCNERLPIMSELLKRLNSVQGQMAARIGCDGDGARSTMWLSCAEQFERELSLIVRWFCDLAGAECSVDRTQHDAVANDCFTHWQAVRSEGFRAHGCEVIVPLRLEMLLGELIELAHTGRRRMAVHFSCLPCAPASEDIRWCRKLIVRQRACGFPGPIISCQEQVLDSYANATYLVEQCVGFENAESASSVMQTMECRLRDLSAVYSLCSTGFEPLDRDELEGVVETGLHTGLIRQPSFETKLATGRAAGDVETILSWCVRSARPSAVPQRLFISYASQDDRLVSKLVQHLEQAGLCCFFAPRDIPYGSSYPAELLAALEDSSAVLVFVTQASSASQFVLREVERAVALRKQIMAVRADRHPPCRDLQFLLSTVQWLDVAGMKPEAIIERTVQTVARGRVQSGNT